MPRPSRYQRRRLWKLRKRNGKCGQTGKVQYGSQDAAIMGAIAMKTTAGRDGIDALNVFLCGVCRTWHVGHKDQWSR